MRFFDVILGSSLGLIYMFAGPATFIVLAIDTWQSRASVAMKLLINITLDTLLAMIWPITWMLWAIQWFIGTENALARVFG